MTRALRMYSYMFAAAVGLAPPAVISHPKPVALPSAVSSKAHAGSTAATMNSADATAFLASRIQGQSPIVRTRTGLDKGRLMALFRKSEGLPQGVRSAIDQPPSKARLITGGFDLLESERVRAASASVPWMISSCAFLLAVVAGSRWWWRRRLAGGATAAVELGVSPGLAWSEQPKVAVAALASEAAGCLDPGPSPGAQEAEFDAEAVALGRRSCVAATAAIAVPWQPSVAGAADAPTALVVSGMPEARAKANGVWKVVSGLVNDRAVYQNQNLFLVVNDCGKLQISESKVSECKNGFARQLEKGKWEVDGKELVGSVKVKKGKAFTASGAKGSTVVVQTEFKSDDDSATKLKPGQMGTVQDVDDEGDVSIAFKGVGTTNYVWKENFGKLLLL